MLLPEQVTIDGVIYAKFEDTDIPIVIEEEEPDEQEID